MRALNSLLRGFRLTSRRQLDHPRGRVGREIVMDDGRRFTIFRETVAGDDAGTGEACVLIVRFRFRRPIPSFAWFHAVFRPACIVTTPFFVGVSGFRIKLWMEDRATHDYQGLYEWASPDEAIRYARGLERILRILSAKGSVTYEVLPHIALATYLAKHSEQTPFAA